MSKISPKMPLFDRVGDWVDKRELWAKEWMTKNESRLALVSG